MFPNFTEIVSGCPNFTDVEPGCANTSVCFIGVLLLCFPLLVCVFLVFYIVVFNFCVFLVFTTVYFSCILHCCV